MTDFIIAVILLLLAIGGVVVRKTYYFVPPKELKRRAASRDPLAEQLYRAVAYDSSLEFLLWLFIGLTAAGGFVLLAQVAPIWLGLILILLVILLTFAWLPSSHVTKFGRWLAVRVTPAVVWLLNYLHAPLARGAHQIEKRTAPAHTGLFEREDFLDFVERQQHQADSRITSEELEIVKQALHFGDYQVRHICVPWHDVKTVPADDTIGPVLIDELHRSDQPFIPVVEGPDSQSVIGMLKVHELGLQSSGHVRDVMDKTVYYLHEHDSLAEALHAFSLTNHPLFVVINSQGACVGILTIESILQQLLGHDAKGDYEQYTDVSVIAHRHEQPTDLDTEIEEAPAASEEPPEDGNNDAPSEQTVVE